MKDNSEIWDLYDSDRSPTGKTIQRGQIIEAGLYHIVVHIWPRCRDMLLMIKQKQFFDYGDFYFHKLFEEDVI